MQTFLPYSNFAESAACLDVRRLGKQRIEAYQVLAVLLQKRWVDNQLVAWVSSSWRNHVCTRSWAGFEGALADYGLAICAEWISRGYRDAMTQRFVAFKRLAVPHLPPWLGTDAIHLSHRSNLIRKKPEHYGPLWPEISGDLPYVWPVPLQRDLQLPLTP
jgi:hypothetical protein